MMLSAPARCALIYDAVGSGALRADL